MSIHVSQFYSCSKVTLASELLYICELGKYCRIGHGHSVDLQGVNLTSGLKASLLWDYFRMAAANGWVSNTGIPAEDLAITAQNPLALDKTNHRNMYFVCTQVPYDKVDAEKRRLDADYDLRTPVKSQVSFEQMDSNLWLWSPKGFKGGDLSVNNRSLNHNFANMAWVSLVAMVAVNRLFSRQPASLLLRLNHNMLMSSMALSHLMALAEETQCMRGWVTYEFDNTVTDKDKLQLSYYAWYSIGKERGLLDRWYNGKEKLAYMKSLDMRVGDIILYYEREQEQKMNYIKKISGCYLAKIVSVDVRDITLELIHTVVPKFQGKEDFDDHTMAVKALYAGSKPYETIRTSRKTVSMADIGVEYEMFSENSFIVPLSSAVDVVPVRVTDGVREETLLLDQNNLIYWILEDYEYDYNRSRFIRMYFSQVEPVRDRYMRGEKLEGAYYPKEG